MARNIGATLSLKEGNFFTNIKSAMSATDNLKKKVGSATATFKTHSSQVNNVGTSLKSLATKVVGVVAAYASIRQIVSFTQDCIAAANAQTAAEQRLQQTMSNVSGTTQVQIDSIKAYAATLQGLTTIGDEVAIHGASQLATFQLQGDTIKTLMPALEDLAVAQYGVSVSSDQMQSMANLVGKVMTGSTSALTRYGVVMNDAQQKVLKTGTESQKAAVLVDVLKQNFGGLAEAMANTPEGRIQQLKNAWGDVQEVIGAKLYPVITKTLTWMAEKIPSVQNVIVGAVNACQPVFTAFTDAVLPSVNNLLQAFKNIGSAIVNAFGEQASGGITRLVTDLIPGLINVLSVAGNGIAAIINHWNIFAPIVAGVATAIGVYKAAVFACNVVEGERNGLITIATTLTGAQAASFAPLTTMTIAQTVATSALSAAQTALNALFLASPIGWIVLAIGAVVAIFAVLWNKCEGFRNFWKGLWSSVKNAVSSAWNAIQPAISAIKNGIGKVVNYLSDLFGGIKKQLEPVLNAVKDTVSEKLSNIKKAYNEHGGGIKGIAAAAIEGVKGYYTAGFTFLDKLTGGKLSAIVSKIGEKLAPVKEKFAAVFEGVKPVITVLITFIKNNFEIAKTTILNIFNGIKDNIMNFVNSVKTSISGIIDGIKLVFEGIKNVIINIVGFIVGVLTLDVDKIKSSLSGIIQGIATIFSGVKEIVVNYLNIIISWFTMIFENIKTVVSNVIVAIVQYLNNVKTTISNVFTAVKDTAINVFETIRQGIVNKIQQAKDTIVNIFDTIKSSIGKVWDGIKNLIKAPHIEVTGHLSIAGLSTPIPKLGLKWYAQGGIMTRPTMFGINGNNAMIGGEAGAEAILPLAQFWKNLKSFIQNAQSRQEGNPVTYNQFDVKIYAENKSVDEMAEEFIDKVKLAYSNM